MNRNYSHRAIALLGLVAAGSVVACGSIEPGARTGASQSSSIWAAAGATLAAGHRTTLVSGGTGWILSETFVGDSVMVTRISLADGSGLGTTVIDDHVRGFAGAGMSEDGTGHLWITYAHKLVRFDERSGVSSFWNIPASVPRVASDSPLAGSALANRWDDSGNRLVFVQNEDQRLYSFVPATAAFGIVADLPITTSLITSIALGLSGMITVTGSVTGTADFSPAAVRIAANLAQPALVTGVLAVCATSTRMTYLSGSGAVSGSDGSVVATVPAPLSTRVPFACDSLDNVFEAVVGSGELVVARVTPSSSTSLLTDALIPVTVQGLGGPVHTFADPSVAALMPDGLGGVWVVSESGTNASPHAGSPLYPTLAHASF